MSNCIICGRKLTSEFGKKAGMGKRCAQKYMNTVSGYKGSNHKLDKQIIKKYSDCINNEKKITPLITKIATENDSKLAGLDFRLKTFRSFHQKVLTDISEGKYDAVNNIYDVVRYTVLSDSENLANTYKNTVESLKKEGVELFRTKNTWLDNNKAYKGVNSVFKDKKGNYFEVQFHTQESLDVKEYIHPIYEKLRSIESLTVGIMDKK